MSASGRPAQDLRRNPREAVRAIARIGLQRSVADEFGETAGRHPSREIHLEKTILGVREASRIGDVVAGAAGDRHGTQPVALDDGIAAETGSRPLAIDRRQAAADRQIRGAGGQQDQQRPRR